MTLNTAREMVALQLRGAVSAAELIADAIGRIEARDVAVNAVVVRDFERALARAREADAALARGESWGPLHGVPITVKECFHVAGLPTTFGRPEFAERRVARTADAVARMVAAGAVVLGKTNVPTDLADCQSANALYGRTSNPHDLRRTCGGSSGGSAAALAAGYVPLEVGSDLAGSIRTPAHFCGVFSHKSSYGAVSSRGHSLDEGNHLEADIAVTGPMASCAHDLDLAFGLMAGSPPGSRWQLALPPARHSSVRGMRIAVLAEHAECKVAHEVRDALLCFASELTRHGASVTLQPHWPIDLSHAHRDFMVMFRAVGLAHAPSSRRAQLAEQVPALDADDFGYAAAGCRAAALGHADWLRLANRREEVRHQWSGFFDSFDLLLCPVHSRTAFPHHLQEPREERKIDVDGEKQPYNDYLFWAGLAGYGGLPASVLPIATDKQGLPIGVQVVGPAFGDLGTLAFAQWAQKEGLAASRLALM